MKTTILHTSSLLLFTSYFAASAAQVPSVDWASSPVKPGDHVLLQGGNWDKDSVVEIGGQRVKPVWITDTGLVFAYPSAKEEVLSGKVVGKDGASESFTLNAPTVWWLQGDEGDCSSPGGWLRAFGKSLAGGKMKVEKVGGGGQWMELSLSRVDDYELAARVPADLACGEYVVEVKSAISDWTKAGTWKVAAPRQLWKKDVFNVKDFGAVPDDGLDDSSAFRDALAAAGKNGGGIVRFGRGVFNLLGTFEIPAHVLVRGETRAETLLDWGDMLEPEHYLLIGDHSFGLEEMTVHTGYSRGFLTHRSANPKDSFWVGAFEPKTHDIVLRNLTLRFVTDEHRDNMPEKAFLARYWWWKVCPYGMNGVPFKLQDVERCTLENVDLYQDKDPTHARFFVLSGWYVRVANCRFHGGGWTEFSGRKVIFEDNESVCCTHSLAAVSTDVYFARNVGRDNFKNDGEGFTHDSSFGAWSARGNSPEAHGSAKGTAVTLRFKNADKLDSKGRAFANINSSKEFELQIISGRGAGQIRRILKMDGWEHVTIDRPFGVEPDETSVFNIAFQRCRVLMLDNRMEDATIGLSLFGDAEDYIMARNRFVRAGGLRVQGLKYSSITPCFRVQVFDNVIEESLGRMPSSFRAIGADLNRATVMRRNVIESNGVFDFHVRDGLVEHNVVRKSRYAFGEQSSGFFLGENTFENVLNPYRHVGGATFGPKAQAARDAWRAKVSAKLRGVRSLTGEQAETLFGLRAGFRPGTAEMKAARAGVAKPFDLPVTVSCDSCVPEFAGVEIIPSEAGGWKFAAKKAALGRDGASWIGIVTVTPSGKPTGFFTVPLIVRLKGKDGWTVEAQVNAATTADMVDNVTAPEWRYAVVSGNELPKDVSKLLWKKVTKIDSRDRLETLNYDLEPSFKKGKDSMAYEQRWEVTKRTMFGLRVYDPSREIYVDGRKFVPVPSYDKLVKYFELEPGIHSILVFRPHPGPMENYRAKNLEVNVLLPRGAEPGSYRVLSVEEDK